MNDEKDNFIANYFMSLMQMINDIYDYLIGVEKYIYAIINYFSLNCQENYQNN